MKGYKRMSRLTLREWGPAGWAWLHTIAHTWPRQPTNDDRREMRAFLLSFSRHLPCPACREHFRAFLDRRLSDESLASRAALVRLLNDAHNEVNLRLGKRAWTLDEHYQAYSTHRHGLKASPWTVVAVTIAVTFAATLATAQLLGCTLPRTRKKFPHICLK